jgi:cobalamin biosynthesis Mg chelatase CobN
MWPKLLLELLPHFSRLVPAADKYLSGRGAADKTHAEAIAALDTGVRGQIAQVSEAQAGLGRQLQEQGAQVAEIAVDVARGRMGIESVEARVAKLEKTLKATVMLLIGVLVLLVVVVTLLVVHAAR